MYVVLKCDAASVGVWYPTYRNSVDDTTTLSKVGKQIISDIVIYLYKKNWKVIHTLKFIEKGELWEQSSARVLNVAVEAVLSGSINFT